MQSIQKILLEFEPKTKNLLPVLKKISTVFGYVDEKEAEFVGEYFSVSVAKVFETASFYDLIKTRKSASLEIQVCSSASCAINNSFSLISEIENIFKIKSGRDNAKIKLEEISCMGKCADGPVMIVNGKIFEKVTKEKIHEILKGYL